MERPTVLSLNTSNTNTDTKHCITPSQMATAAAPLEPRNGSLAWFMLCHGTLLPQQSLSNSTTTRVFSNLPSDVQHLDFDLGVEVNAFAMEYDSIAFNPTAYLETVVDEPDTVGETDLKRFLSFTLWNDVDEGFKAAGNLPYVFDAIDMNQGEDARIRKRIAGANKLQRPKIAIIEVKTASSLTQDQMQRLRDQKPWEADNHNRHILAQLLSYFRAARVNWGAVTNGDASIFIRYEPIPNVFAMSELIEHSSRDIIGYYCLLARLGDRDATDHPRLSAGPPIHQASSADALSPTVTTVFMCMFLDAPRAQGGNFASIYDGTWDSEDQGPIPVIAKVSYASKKSNDSVIREIELYYRLRELWGTVIPIMYGAGPHKIDGDESGAYAIALERLEAIEDWNPETKMQAKQAIQELHRRGIVHGDIRRANFTRRRETGQVVIIDFGNSHEGTAEEMEEELRSLDDL